MELHKYKDFHSTISRQNLSDCAVIWLDFRNCFCFNKILSLRLHSKCVNYSSIFLFSSKNFFPIPNILFLLTFFLTVNVIWCSEVRCIVQPWFQGILAISFPMPSDEPRHILIHHCRALPTNSCYKKAASSGIESNGLGHQPPIMHSVTDHKI